MRGTIILFCVLSIFSCSKLKTSKTVKFMLGKTIVLPNMDCVNSNDSLTYSNYMTSSLKIIIWIDSTECSLCRFERMEDYSFIYSYCNDSLPMGMVNVLTIFSPSKLQLDQFRELLDTHNSIYPIFIDVNNSFVKMNPFIPAEPKYHGFLINEDNKIEVLGMPFYNDEIWNLYKSALSKVTDNID